MTAAIIIGTLFTAFVVFALLTLGVADADPSRVVYAFAVAVAYFVTAQYFAGEWEAAWASTQQWSRAFDTSTVALMMASAALTLTLLQLSRR